MNKSNEINISKYNNIEWLRLFFAAQVMFVHVFHHMNSAHLMFFDNFPGVPAFFFLSGFLIYASFMKSKSIKSYFTNRFFRLFPALLFVSVAGIVVVILGKYINNDAIDVSALFIWFLAQISIGQAFNPSDFRNLGVGVINGSLWTITVEILFYISVPFIVLLEKYFKYMVGLLFILSFSMYVFGSELFSVELARGKSLFEFMSLTPLIWGWMFLLGVLTYKYYIVISKYIRYFGFAIIPLTILILLDSRNVIWGSAGNELGILYFIFYAMLILYLSFATKFIPLKFDISYGVYIWHMVIVNLFLVLGLLNPWYIILITIIAATFSWFYIEKPALMKKKYSLHQDIAKSA